MSKSRRLTPELVSQALRTRVVSTKRLRRNGPDEIVWRWLKQEISAHPQNFVELKISEVEHYTVAIYGATLLSKQELADANTKLKVKGLPPLKAGKPYARLQVNQAGALCPEWYGLIDLESAKLFFFEGMSA
jgi:hypothetical protein